MEKSDIHKIMKHYDNVFTRNLSVSNLTTFDVYRFKANIPVIGNKTVCKLSVQRINKDKHRKKAYYCDYRKINDATSIADAIDISQKIYSENALLSTETITPSDFEDLIKNYVALANKLIMLDNQERLIKQIEGD